MNLELKLRNKKTGKPYIVLTNGEHYTITELCGEEEQ